MNASVSTRSRGLAAGMTGQIQRSLAMYRFARRTPLKASPRRAKVVPPSGIAAGVGGGANEDTPLNRTAAMIIERMILL